MLDRNLIKQRLEFEIKLAKYTNSNYTINTSVALMQNTLDLIESLEAELRHKVEYIDELCETISKLKEEPKEPKAIKKRWKLF